MNEDYERGYDRGVLDTVEELQKQVHNWNELKKYFKRQTIDLEKIREDISTDHYIDRKMFLKEALSKMQELEGVSNE